MRFIFLIMMTSILFIENAYAYVGPGLGLGAIGALVGVIVAVLLGIIGVVWYPLKRMLRKRNATNDSTESGSADEKSSDG